MVRLSGLQITALTVPGVTDIDIFFSLLLLLSNLLIKYITFFDVAMIEGAKVV
jgi:hypothetical protein